MTHSRVHALLRSHLLLLILCWHVTVLYISVCDSCDSFSLNKWNGIRSIFRQTEGPVTASQSLSACSRWCVGTASCMLLAWETGSCWQVGFCGTQNVTGRVYDLRLKELVQDTAGWYMIPILRHTYIHACMLPSIHTYIFVVVNFDVLAQASNFLIQRRQFVFLSWMLDSTHGPWNRIKRGKQAKHWGHVAWFHKHKINVICPEQTAKCSPFHIYLLNLSK